MKSQSAHLVIGKGYPLCELPQLLSRAIPCGHLTVSAAKDTAKMLRADGYRVTVVKGRCPHDRA